MSWATPADDNPFAVSRATPCWLVFSLFVRKTSGGWLSSVVLHFFPPVAPTPVPSPSHIRDVCFDRREKATRQCAL